MVEITDNGKMIVSCVGTVDDMLRLVNGERKILESNGLKPEIKRSLMCAVRYKYGEHVIFLREIPLYKKENVDSYLSAHKELNDSKNALMV